MADKLQVTAVDIFFRPSVHALEFERLRWNLNARFSDDSSKRQLKPEVFYLVNSRFLIDGIDEHRWEPLIQEYKELLVKGGWLQMAEVQWTFHSLNNQALPNLARWSSAYYTALRLMGKKPDVATRQLESRTIPLETHVRWAGFARVNGSIHDIPVGNWRPGTCGCMPLLYSLRVVRLTDSRR